MFPWRNNTVKITQSISLFLFLSSKPSRKHPDTADLTSYLRGRARYICIFIFHAREKSVCAIEISAAHAIWWIHCSEPGDSWESRRNVSATTNPGVTWGTRSASLDEGLEERGTAWGETGNFCWPFALSLRWELQQPAFIYSDKNNRISSTQIKGHRWLLWLKEKGKDIGSSYKVPQEKAECCTFVGWKELLSTFPAPNGIPWGLLFITFKRSAIVSKCFLSMLKPHSALWYRDKRNICWLSPPQTE